MSQTSKPFEPIRDAYAFFQQHTTETEEDICAYLPHIHGVSMGDSPLRTLDFGCGDDTFTAALLGRVHVPPERLQLVRRRTPQSAREAGAAPTCASAASAWGSQNVMSIAWYSAMAVDSAARAFSICPIWLYNVPSPSWQWAVRGRMPSSSARERAWR